MFERKFCFGFLSTYEHTVFIRRVENYKFVVSDPIARTASNPSLRECFLFVGREVIRAGHRFGGVADPTKLVIHPAYSIYLKPLLALVKG